MALSIDHSTLVITVPQADLTFVSGTFYRMDTETYFRQGLNALMADEDHIQLETPIFHETESVLVGVTYARKMTLINGYSLVFTPDAQWTVELIGSNNNFFDVANGILNQNQVQVIPGNSAGLQIVSVGSGLSAAQATQLLEIYTRLGLNVGDPFTHTPSSQSSQSGDIDIDLTGDGIATTTQTRQP